MEKTRLRELLQSVARADTSVDEAMRALRALPFADLGYARVDHHRALRTGFPEVVLGQGKHPDHLCGVVRELVSSGVNVLCTRVTPEQAQAVAMVEPLAEHLPLPRLIVVRQVPVPELGRGPVLVISAGTSDLPVAEEAAVTAELMGSRVERLWDVGVAGLHRILAERERLHRAAILVVVAGMEGALPSVVAGLSGRPVIAVPTSTGYGASFGGVAALLGMLSSCAAGVTVVNIDNGFGAGYAAALLNRSEAE